MNQPTKEKGRHREIETKTGFDPGETNELRILTHPYTTNKLKV